MIHWNDFIAQWLIKPYEAQCFYNSAYNVGSFQTFTILSCFPINIYIWISLKQYIRLKSKMTYQNISSINFFILLAIFFLF